MKEVLKSKHTHNQIGLIFFNYNYKLKILIINLKNREKAIDLEEGDVEKINSLIEYNDDDNWQSQSDDDDILDPNESSCLDDLKQCKPFIKSGTKRFNLNNQLRFDLKHCFCAIKFFNCLKLFSPSSKLGHVYFNLLKFKCFHYQYASSCRLYLFGKCFIRGEFECQIRVIDNFIF